MLHEDCSFIHLIVPYIHTIQDGLTENIEIGLPIAAAFPRRSTNTRT